MSVAHNEDSPQSYRERAVISRHNPNASTSSLDKKQQNLSMAHVNKLNKPLQQKLQFNATTLGKRFIHKSVPRQASKSVNQSTTVTHHPLHKRKDSY